MSASRTLFPAPVGPTTRVWPTSPTCSDNRNGVAPSVLANNNGGPPRCSLRSGPAHTAESGIMWARLSVETGGLADIGVDMTGQASEPGLDRVDALCDACEIASLDHLLDQP